MDAHALWHIDPTHSLLRPQTLAKLRPDECLVKTRYSMVSQGTERLVSRGLIDPAAFGPMRVPYMQGDFSFPLTYGYSLVGEVIDGPQEWRGELVHAMHPHQDICVIHKDDLTVIPPNVPLDRAVLASNMETAVNGIWDSQPVMGQDILVIGYGLIGALIAWLLRPVPGMTLNIVDIQSQRSLLAAAHGHQVIQARDIRKEGYDVVFHTSASSSGLQLAIDSTREEGRIMEMSCHGSREVSLNLGTSFHFGRKRIISSQVSRIASPALPYFDHQRRKDLVFRLLADTSLQDYLGEAIPFEDAPSFFEQLRKGNVSGLNTYFTYD